MITGGTSMLPGFKSRLVAELNELLQRSPYKEELAIQNLKFHQIPAKENYVAWLGGKSHIFIPSLLILTVMPILLTSHSSVTY